jgi:outer membrane protein
MSIRNRVIGAAAGALMFISCWQPALAQQAGGFALEVPEVQNYVAAAVGAIPDYLGSDDYTVGAAPAGIVRFGDSERYVRVFITQLSANLLDNESWAFGPTANYRFGRDDDSIDDDVVGRMRDIDGTLEAGAFLSWKWVADVDPRQRFIVSTDFLYDVTGEHDGFVASGSVRYFHPVSRAITLSGGLSTSYGSDDYTSTYFGVDAADAARSGLSFFDADGGFRDVRANVMAIFSFSPNWHVGAGLVYSRLLGDAEDSPVVDDRGSANQLFAGVGLAYAW